MSVIFDEKLKRLDAFVKTGCLNDGAHLICIEVPELYDQCMIHRNLTFEEGADTQCTDKELRSNPLYHPKTFLGCGSMNLKVLSIEKVPLSENPAYKEVTLHFVIWFYAYFRDVFGKKRKELYEINRYETIPRLYCPEDTSPSALGNFCGINSDDIKAELSAECTGGSFSKDSSLQTILDVDMEYALVVKSQKVKQLLVPTYDLDYLEQKRRENGEQHAAETKKSSAAHSKKPVPPHDHYYKDRIHIPLDEEVTDHALAQTFHYGNITINVSNGSLPATQKSGSSFKSYIQD